MGQFLDFSRTKFASDRPITSYGKVQAMISALIRNRYVKRSRLEGKSLLNVGCGTNSAPRFINLDWTWNPGIDLCWDATRRLPLADGSMAGIFTEHCLEHVPFADMPRVLAEFRRVLHVGGNLRIVVPDGEIYLRGYANGTSLPYAESDSAHGVYSPIMSVNRIARGHGHQFLYDFDTFRQLLERAGFSDVRKESFGKGRNAALLIDTHWHQGESLYVEGTAR